ncbi:unnamed protein product [Parnassius mnemosyne]|uniref:Uncharacterized protein n=1 Tax=Parnassius mnemosyne TaxID=213953 RepID=A0AAV1KB09_9NEOP
MEQRTLSCSLEISGITSSVKANEVNITQEITKKLDLDTGSIVCARRLPTCRENPGNIIVELRSKDARDQCIEASKKAQLTLSVFGKNVPREQARIRIFIREPLSPYIKNLYYNARNSLKTSHKYVWCKNGLIFCRKTDDSKVLTIRSNQDISKLSE